MKIGSVKNILEKQFEDKKETVEVDEISKENKIVEDFIFKDYINVLGN